MSFLSDAMGHLGHLPWPGVGRSAAPTVTVSAPAAAPARSGAFRPDVEGLRGVAILFVLLFHADLAPLPGGFVGVDVFFVVSGFLITGLLLRERERTGRIDLVGFYGRRVRRLVPAALVAMAVILPLGYAVLPPLDRPGLALDGAAAAASVANIRFGFAAGDYFAAVGTPSPFLHFWSLSVEEQFYVAWPLLLLLGARARRPRVGVAIALGVVVVGSFAACLVAAQAAPGWAFYLLPTRAWQLATGGLVAIGAVALARVPGPLLAALGWAGLAAVLAAPLVVDPSAAYPGTAALLPTLGTAALIAAGERRWSPARLLSVAPLRFLGRISYSLYLWHWPILVLPAAALAVPPEAPARACLAAVSIVVATASWACVEEPFRRGTWRLDLRAPRALAAAAAALAFVVALSGGLWLRAGSDLGLAAPWQATDPGDVAGVDDAIDWASGDPAVDVVIDLVSDGGDADPADDGSGATGGRPADGTGAPGGGTGEIDPPTGDPRTSPTPDGPAASPDATPGAGAGPTPTTSPRPAPGSWALPRDVRPAVGRARDDVERPVRDGCLAWEGATVPPDCVYGDRAAAFNVALVGDSHASHLFPAVAAVASRHGWRLETYLKVSCPFIDLRVRNLGLKREYTECATWRTNVVRRLAADPPDLVLVSVSRWIFPVRPADGTAELQGEALARMIGRLPGRVVVIADLPAWNLDVPACLSAHPGDIRPCAMPRAAAFASILVRERIATKATGAALVNMARVVCPGDPCPAVVDGMIVLRDSHHLTATFARSLAPTLDRALARLLAPPPPPEASPTPDPTPAPTPSLTPDPTPDPTAAPPAADAIPAFRRSRA